MVASTNPLREGLRTELTAEPCVVVIFGATGDLTHRKLMPALYNLGLERRLPAGTALVGFARRPWGDDGFRSRMFEAIKEFSDQTFRQAPAERYTEGIRYVEASFEDPAGYEELKRICEELDQARGTRGNRLFYLATAPTAFPTIIEQLGAAGLVERRGKSDGEGGWTRMVVEKPFGRDLATARELNAELARVFSEDQVYRIDHYLGKETVQNIMA